MNDNDFGYLADHDDMPFAMRPWTPDPALEQAAWGDYPHLTDAADDMAQAMQEQEMMYVDSLRRVVNGTATVEDARTLAAGCGIDFRLIT